jgi:flavodoxin short chain
MANTLLIYGSLTGNTEGVAYSVQTILREKGKEIDVKNAIDADLTDLTGNYSNFIFACSTWDDGLPQSDFNDFIERIISAKPSLAGKKIAILGLGDSNYVHFCGATTVIEKAFITDLSGNKIIETLHIDGYPEMEENKNHIKTWTEKLADLIN